jgi:tetratricopeptide (TPR) repeat protein
MTSDADSDKKGKPDGLDETVTDRARRARAIEPSKLAGPGFLSVDFAGRGTQLDTAANVPSMAQGRCDHQQPAGEQAEGTLSLIPMERPLPETRASTVSPGETIDPRGDPTATQEWSGGLGITGSRPAPARVRANTSKERFQVLRSHARGGLGEVYLAHDRELNREVALKAIQDRFAESPDSRRRFLVEAEITGCLEHPGIVPVYSLSFDAEGHPFYAMRFIRGESLAHVISIFHAGGGLGDGEHTLEFRQLLQRFVDVCNTIAFAHSHSVIHRDLKPANVMLGPYGETLVVDWGLAKRLDKKGGIEEAHSLPGAAGSSLETAETISGSAMGTPAYMSPEQALGQIDLLGPASDVYSLGATLYVLLTGREAFSGSTVFEVLGRVADGDFPRVRDVNRTVPAALEAICLKAMSLRPADRYESARGLAEEIEHWMADEPVLVYREPWRDRLARWGRRHRTWARAGGTALCIVTIIAVLAAVIVNGARRREHIARVRENQQRLLAEELTTQQQSRLRTTRMEAATLFQQGTDLVQRADWRAARLQFARVLAMTRDEADLADLTSLALRLEGEVERRLVQQEAEQKARGTYELFQKRRDDALFHGTLFTGLDLAANLDATRDAARGALALYGVRPDGGAVSIVPSSLLSSDQQDEIKKGCHELLMLFADAEAMSGRDQDIEHKRAYARRALRILEQAAGIGPGTRSYHVRRARYLEQAGDLVGAQDETARAAGIEPTLPVDLFLLGEQLHKQGAVDEASHLFEAELLLRPDDFWAQYFLAVCHLKADPLRPSEAKAHLTASLSRRPRFAWVYLLRGYAHGELGEFTDADADFDRALQLSSDEGIRFGVLVNRGGMRIRQRKFEIAIVDLTEAVRLKPNQHQAHANLGLAYGGQKRWDAAIEELDLALRLAPGQPGLYRNRALMKLGRQDLGAALDDFGEAIRLTQGPSRVLASDHAHRGRILYRLKRWKEASAAFEAAVALQGDDREFERLRAETLLALGNGREAIRAFNRYLDPSDTDPAALRQRGFERARIADSAGALADYTRALALDPNSPSTRARRGWGLLGDASKLALHDFEEAIKLDPKNGDLYCGRALARVVLGDHAGGVADAETGMKLGIPGDDRRGQIALNYNGACIYAQAAAKAAFIAETQDRQALVKRYQDRAVALFRQTINQIPAAARASFVKQATLDPALDTIRAYPPFMRLIADLTTSDPKHRNGQDQ